MISSAILNSLKNSQSYTSKSILREMVDIKNTLNNSFSEWSQVSEPENELLSQENVEDCSLQQINPLTEELTDLTQHVQGLVSQSKPISPTNNFKRCVHTGNRRPTKGEQKGRKAYRRIK